MIDHQWLRISWQFSVIDRAILQPRVRVVFCLGRLLRNTPAHSVSVIGLEVDLPRTATSRRPFCPVDFDALLAKIMSCPTTLVINFFFTECTSEDLQDMMQKYRPFNWNPQTEARTIVFTVRSSFRLSAAWARIDPVTLSPTGEFTFKFVSNITQYQTGQIWQRHEDIIPSLVSEQSQDEDHVL